jgi:hypothetical protein
MVEASLETIHRQPPESLRMSLSPATDRDVVTVAVPTHNRADVVGKTIEPIVWQRDVTVGDRSSDGSQALSPKNGDLLAAATLQRHLDAGTSRGADRLPFSTTSFDKRLTPVGGQHLPDSDLDRQHVRLLRTTDVESPIEWRNPYDAALSGAAK